MRQTSRSGSSRYTAGERIRSISIPKWLMRKRSRRRSAIARLAISSFGMPPAAAAAMSAPMLVPA
jgi:hypothetical protein